MPAAAPGRHIGYPPVQPIWQPRLLAPAAGNRSRQPQPATGTRHPAPGTIGTLAAAKSQLIHQITTRRKHEHTMV